MKSFWKNRYVHAQRIALAATPLSVIGFIGIIGSMDGEMVAIWPILFVLGMALTCVAYLLGGLLTAIKCALKIAKWGWIIIPFPYDLVTGFLAFFAGLLVFLLVPIIPVRKAYLEHTAYSN